MLSVTFTDIVVAILQGSQAPLQIICGVWTLSSTSKDGRMTQVKTHAFRRYFGMLNAYKSCE
jgi:hypothetical protein